VYSDANKTLHDTNDDLREALEHKRSATKRPRSAVKHSYFLWPLYCFILGPTLLLTL